MILEEFSQERLARVCKKLTRYLARFSPRFFQDLTRLTNSLVPGRLQGIWTRQKNSWYRFSGQQLRGKKDNGRKQQCFKYMVSFSLVHLYVNFPGKFSNFFSVQSVHSVVSCWMPVDSSSRCNPPKLHLFPHFVSTKSVTIRSDYVTFESTQTNILVSSCSKNNNNLKFFSDTFGVSSTLPTLQIPREGPKASSVSPDGQFAHFDVWSGCGNLQYKSSRHQ